MALSAAIHAAAGPPGASPDPARRSRLYGRSPDEVAVADGRIHLIATLGRAGDTTSWPAATWTR